MPSVIQIHRRMCYITSLFSYGLNCVQDEWKKHFCQGEKISMEEMFQSEFQE